MSTATLAPALIEIPIEQVHPSATNPRKHFDEGALSELAASISSTGIQVPLLVRPNSAGYEIVAGERRYLAAKKLQLAVVPCLAREMSDDEAREIQIVENLQRADVHPVEEAEAYKALIVAAGYELRLQAEDIAKRVGKSVAYVATRLRLLTLELDAKQLYAKGHLTLDHALLLARLTPRDQERALVFLLGSNPKHDKRPASALIRDRLSYGGLHGRRLIEPTSQQLKEWIQREVLLRLVDATWDLGDAELVSTAGPCTTCPKRSGANAALFGELTAKDDVCTDAVCYSAKLAALVKRHTSAARAQGAKLLKISDTESKSKLQEPAVVDGKVTTAKKVLRGQWVKAKEGSCPSAVQAVVTDGKDKGELRTVCPDQTCKTHKHEIHSSSDSDGARNRERSLTPEERAAAKAAIDVAIAAEVSIRSSIYQLVVEKFQNPTGKDDPDGLVLRALLSDRIENNYPEDVDHVAICTWLKIPTLKKPATDGPGQYNEDWKRRRDAEEKLRKYSNTCKAEELWMLCFHVQHIHTLQVDERDVQGKSRDRKEILGLAMRYGVKSKAEAVIAKAAATKAPAKKSPAKKAIKTKPAKKVAGK
jgi:ParB family chromosome partitioning protein